jgi:COMPASS component SWD3
MGCRFRMYFNLEYNTTNVLMMCSTRGVFLCVWQGLTSKVLKGHTSYVFCVNYNTEGTQLVSGGCEGDVRIWNAAKGARNLLSRDLCSWIGNSPCAGRCTKTLNAHLDYVTAVHFNRDGSLIVSCSLDGLMCVPPHNTSHFSFHHPHIHIPLTAVYGVYHPDNASRL